MRVYWVGRWEGRKTVSRQLERRASRVGEEVGGKVVRGPSRGWLGGREKGGNGGKWERGYHF